VGDSTVRPPRQPVFLEEPELALVAEPLLRQPAELDSGVC
jgi:hypothetical protein